MPFPLFSEKGIHAKKSPIKAYAEQEPDDLETYLDSDGVRRMQPVMEKCSSISVPI